MGSRGRSIRLRIYFLVAIPLIAMVGLLAYVAGTSINNAINLDRAPNLIHATSLPTAEFTRLVQDERAAAVVYLFEPTAANLAAYDAAVKATDADKPAFLAAMNSPGTKSSETADEAKAIDTLITGLGQVPALRAGVTGQALTPLAALGGYSAGIQDELKLFLAEADSLTNATAADQALGLIATVSAREALSQEYALLSGVLAGQRMTQADRAAFAEMVATRQGDMVDAGSLLDPANLAIFDRQVNNTEQTQLTQIEEVVSAGTPLTKLPITSDQWQGLAGQLLGQYYAGGVNVANAQLVSDRQISNDAKTRVVITGGIGLVGLLLTIMVTILVARGIIRRLGGLERTALQLAEVQLPDVVARLRRGEDVDVDTEAPPLQVGRDEIGRVGQAFDLVRQTAVRAAVDEARLRRGLNDVFRSLARRSQSLLHRQLTLLDQMERRASDPAALDDLFRLDHLTTRMRRHAEGLVILAGAPPSRGWSSPVRMVDVMRGAIAEVEDYARVAVATRSQAALAGSAVADVIHLLAELIENATTLSPPYTSVRVSGDTVASGFAIEVEDRGLGIRPQRLAELNDRLASPPEFNPSDSEQLGLFVVSQLAKRHGIRVTLKTSAYGGTAAVVLIPRQLVVTEDAGRAGLPGGPAAVAVAELETNGYHAVAAAPDDPGRPSGPAFPELRGLPGTPQAPGIRISGALRHSQGTSTEDLGHGAHAAPPSPVNGGPGPQADPGDLPRRQDSDGRQNGAGQVPFAGVGSAPDGTPPSAFDVFTPRRRGQDTGEATVPDDAGPGQDLAAAAASPADAVPFAPIMPAPTAGTRLTRWLRIRPPRWHRRLPVRRTRDRLRRGRFPGRGARGHRRARTRTRRPVSRPRKTISRGFRAGSGRPAWLPSSGLTRRSAGSRWPAAGRPAGRRPRTSAGPCRPFSAVGSRAAPSRPRSGRKRAAVAAVRRHSRLIRGRTARGRQLIPGSGRRRRFNRGRGATWAIRRNLIPARQATSASSTGCLMISCDASGRSARPSSCPRTASR